MFPIRVTIFIISLLLVTEAVEPSQAWFIALAVLTGLSIFGGGGFPFFWGGPWDRRWRDRQSRGPRPPWRWGDEW